MYALRLAIRGSMARQFGFEIPQAGPPQSLLQVDLGHNHGSPFLGVNELVSRMVVYCSEHPLARDIFVCAADEVDVIFAGARRSQQRVAAPHGPRDHFGAVVAQTSRYFGKEAVVTDHHSDSAESRVEDRIFIARRDAGRDFASRQCDFAVFAYDLS